MSRKDSKGRVLKTGESERKGGTYQYRFTDIMKRRHTVYAPTLKELREKEVEIQKQILDGENYALGKITVEDLIQKFYKTKTGVREQTKDRYINKMRRIAKYPFSKMLVDKVKISDAKNFIVELYDEGLKMNTVSGYKAFLSSVFNLAYESEIINRNPFSFKISSIISEKKPQRFALSVEQQELLMGYIANHPIYYKYYDEFNVLLGTGLRIGEFCGLTVNDVDFKKNHISVNHQICKIHGSYRISFPKSEKGNRYIPMTVSVQESMRKIVDKCLKSKILCTLDGYSGFLFISPDAEVIKPTTILARIKRIVKSYNRGKDEKDKLPDISPHIFRHTFCKNIIRMGISLQDVQAIMGHSKLDTTMEVYAHYTSEDAIESVTKVLTM